MKADATVEEMLESPELPFVGAVLDSERPFLERFNDGMKLCSRF